MKAKTCPFRSLLLMVSLLFSSHCLLAQSQQPSPSSAATEPKTEAMALVKQGQNLNNAGKLDEAIAMYQKALQLDPRLYDAELYMGVSLDLQGKYAEARQHLAKAIELASEAQRTDVPTGEKPALFMYERDDTYTNGKNYLPIVEMNVDLYIYIDAGKHQSLVPSSTLNPLIDAIDAALAPSKVNNRQTLGGLVSHCWIDGKIMKDPGDLDGIAVIPVKILASV